MLRKKYVLICHQLYKLVNNALSGAAKQFIEEIHFLNPNFSNNLENFKELGYTIEYIVCGKNYTCYSYKEFI